VAVIGAAVFGTVDDVVTGSWRGARLERASAVAGWSIVVAAGSVTASVLAGRTRSVLSAALQTVAPHAALAMAPVAVGALVGRRRTLAAAAGLVGVGGLGALRPLRGVRPPDVTPGAVGLRVATVNLLYTNGATARIADDLLGRHLDVVVFTEYTEAHKSALDRHPLAAALPHHIDREGPRAKGLAIWSASPIAEAPRLSTINHSIDATVAGPDGDIRVL